jgi:hypothetical protein
VLRHASVDGIASCLFWKKMILDFLTSNKNADSEVRENASSAVGVFMWEVRHKALGLGQKSDQ